MTQPYLKLNCTPNETTEIYRYGTAETSTFALLVGIITVLCILLNVVGKLNYTIPAVCHVGKLN